MRKRTAHLVGAGGRTLCGRPLLAGTRAHQSRGMCSACSRKSDGWTVCWDADGWLLVPLTANAAYSARPVATP